MVVMGPYDQVMESGMWIAVAVLSAATICAALVLAIRQLVCLWRDDDE